MNLLPEISLNNISTLWNFYCFPTFLYFAFRETMKNMDNPKCINTYLSLQIKKLKRETGWTEAKVDFSFILIEFVLFSFVFFYF